MIRHLKLNQVIFNSEQKEATTYTFSGGKTYLLIGQNGAGKTTVIESIAGMREVVSGEIIIDADPLIIKKRTRNIWNKQALEKTSIQLQHTEQYWSAEHLQQEQELQWGSSHDKAQLEHYYSLFHIDEHFHKQELQLLSVGQQKKAALALSFAKESSWLLLDEPLAALDEKGKVQLLDALNYRKSLGLSTIIVSHQTLEVLQAIDAIVLVENLQLYEQNMMSYHEQQEVYEELAFSRLVADETIDAEDDTGSSHYKLAQNDDARRMIDAKRSQHNASGQLHSVFDPRAIIASILLASSIVVYSNSWVATMGYMLIGSAILWFFRKRAKNWMSIIFSFTILSVLFAVVGGVELSPFEFHTTSAMNILQRMMQLLAIIMLGLPIMELLTPFRLQRALEQSFSWLAKLNITIYPYTMLISLIFRLVPLLLQKWNRTIAISRAKYNFVSLLTVRSFSLLLLPYLRGILRLADQVATSLELRGYRSDQLGKNMYYRVKWRKQDTLLVTVFMVLSTILLAFSLIL